MTAAVSDQYVRKMFGESYLCRTDSHIARRILQSDRRIPRGIWIALYSEDTEDGEGRFVAEVGQ